MAVIPPRTGIPKRLDGYPYVEWVPFTEPYCWNQDDTPGVRIRVWESAGKRLLVTVTEIEFA